MPNALTLVFSVGAGRRLSRNSLTKVPQRTARKRYCLVQSIAVGYIAVRGPLVAPSGPLKPTEQAPARSLVPAGAGMHVPRRATFLLNRLTALASHGMQPRSSRLPLRPARRTHVVLHSSGHSARRPPSPAHSITNLTADTPTRSALSHEEAAPVHLTAVIIVQQTSTLSYFKSILSVSHARRCHSNTSRHCHSNTFVAVTYSAQFTGVTFPIYLAAAKSPTKLSPTNT